MMPSELMIFCICVLFAIGVGCLVNFVHTRDYIMAGIGGTSIMFFIISIGVIICRMTK